LEYNLVNYKPAIARLGDDVELYKILITFWFEKKQFEKEELLKLETTGTNDECITYLHSLKGVAANIGADKLQIAAQNLENMYRSRKQSEKILAINEIEKLFIATSTQLKDLENNL
jgi:HPt (histidine-containing phosphotransfer) domain-containing protein